MSVGICPGIRLGGNAWISHKLVQKYLLKHWFFFWCEPQKNLFKLCYINPVRIRDPISMKPRLKRGYPFTVSAPSSVVSFMSAEQRTIIRQYGDWYTGRWWVGCYIRYSEEGLGRLRLRPVPSSLYQKKCNSSGGSRPGPGGLGPLTFCPSSQFFHRLLIILPTRRSGARPPPPPRVFWLEPPLRNSPPINGQCTNLSF